jgi:hypothetical protein
MNSEAFGDGKQIPSRAALLFAALRSSLGTNTDISGAAVARADVQAVLAIAAREQLDALVARGLLALGLCLEPHDLERRRSQALRRALLLERNRAEVREALEQQGIRPVFLKAALCDSLWWGGQGLRGATDIDVLVPRACESAASEILRSIGYDRKLFHGRRAVLEATKERMFVPRDPQRFAVDLHLGLLNEPPYRDPAAEVIARARTYPTSAGPIAGPAPEDMLVHAGGNLGQEAFAFPLKLALDSACLIRTGCLDYEAVFERAQSWRVCTPLWALLRRVQTELGICVPDRLLRRLAPPLWLRPIVERSAAVRFSAPRFASTGTQLLLSDWPMSGRVFWPLSATCRWARLRLAGRGPEAPAAPPAASGPSGIPSGSDTQ